MREWGLWVSSRGIPNIDWEKHREDTRWTYCSSGSETPNAFAPEPGTHGTALRVGLSSSQCAGAIAPVISETLQDTVASGFFGASVIRACLRFPRVIPEVALIQMESWSAQSPPKQGTYPCPQTLGIGKKRHWVWWRRVPAFWRYGAAETVC